ncbi:hypothetical protein [Halobacteriovorax sp.]|uniref:hypothetical protein n=1 Tax=Halobacteriovorax sp. TaxID=2020862 RepID=UPI003AF29078
MHKLKTLINFNFFILSLCVLFWTHGVFAYGEDYDRGQHHQSNENKIEELQESINTLSKQIENSDQDESGETPNLKDLSEKLKASELSTNGSKALPQGLGTTGISKTNPAQMRMAIKMINSQFKYMPDDEIAQMIHSSLEGKPMAGFLINSERLTSFLIGMVKDEKALLYLFELTQDKKVMKLAFFTIIGLIIINFFLRRKIIKKDDFILTRFVKGLLFFVISTGLKVGILYFLYKDYLGPTVDIFVERVL